MPTDNPRITFMVTEETHQRINNYQHDKKLKNQSQAILELIRQSLDAIDAYDESVKQAEIAALAKSELVHDEAELVAAYRKLNPDGQHMALGMVESLTLNPAYTQDTSNAAG